MPSKRSTYRTQRREQRAAKRRQQQTVLIAVLVVILVIILFVVYKALSKPIATTNNMITTASGLQYEDTKVGTGAEAQNGKSVTVHYVGTLQDGTKFDSSRDKNQPFTFFLGTSEVIKGWDEGVAGMKVGGIRKLVVPPALGYGSQANGSIPANSTLYFEVELLSVK